MKACCLFVLLLLSAWSVWAQSVPFKKTCRRWQQGKIVAKEAEQHFEAFENHPKHGATALYYGTVVRLPDIRTMHQAQVENVRLLKAIRSMRVLPARRIRKIRRIYGVDSLQMASLRERLQFQMLAQARATGTLFALDTLQLMETPLPAVASLIDTAIRDIVQQRLSTTDYDEAVILLKKYTNRIRPADYQRSRILYRQSWEMFQEKYPLCQMERYARDYPRSFIARDCWRTEATALLCVGKPSELLDFLARTPWTALEQLISQNLLQQTFPEEGLTASQRLHLEEMRARQTLLESLWSGSARDTADMAEAVSRHIKKYAPRYSSFKLMETALQHFLKTKHTQSAIALLQEVRPYFPDTLPKSCNSNFDFQKRTIPWIDGKLPILRRSEKPVKIDALSVVNTQEGDESHPVISADGTILYFAAFHRPDYPSDDQNIFVSTRSDTGWTAPRPVAAFSGPADEVPLSITADGQEMLLSVQGRMHLSRRTGRQEWTAPRPLSISGLGSIGQGFLSADGQILILEGSYSPPNQYNVPDQDLFVSFRQPGNTWSRPVALGSDINTDAQEGNPFLSGDGRTLWFTSDGWPGLGKSDLFRTERTDPEKWTLWQRPQNLGKNINDTYPQSTISFPALPASSFFTTRSRAEKSDVINVYEE